MDVAEIPGWRWEHQPLGLLSRGSILVPDHPFQPVAGHPDDDECTFRSDGTDATYCGLRARHH